MNVSAIKTHLSDLSDLKVDSPAPSDLQSGLWLLRNIDALGSRTVPLCFRNALCNGPNCKAKNAAFDSATWAIVRESLRLQSKW